MYIPVLPSQTAMSLYQSARKKKSASNLEKRQSFYLPSKPPSQASLQQPAKKAEETVAQDISYPGKVITIERGHPGIGSIAVPTSIIRESFHRRAGIREIIDPSGVYKLRTVEIKRNHGESIGFYITQGDGWKRTNGIFVSRVNLGSVVDTNDLLHVGEEIIKVNGEDITDMPLSNVVLLIKKKRNILRLTVKLPTSEAILKTFSTKHKPSMTVPSVIQEATALADVAVQIKSTPEIELKQVAQSNDQAFETISPTLVENVALKEPIVSANFRSSLVSNDSPLSSSPPSPPTSPVPEFLEDSPIPSPSLDRSIQSHSHSPAGSTHSTASSSDDHELTDSLKGLLDFPSMFDSTSSVTEEVASSRSSSSGSPPSCLPPSVFVYPLTPPTSVSSSNRTISNSSPFTQQLQISSSHSHSSSPPPTPPTFLPPSQPPTPPSTPPPPLPTSPPPILSHEPISPVPSDEDEDIFRLNEIESHLHQWLTHYETNGTTEQIKN